MAIRQSPTITARADMAHGLWVNRRTASAVRLEARADPAWAATSAATGSTSRGCAMKPLPFLPPLAGPLSPGDSDRWSWRHARRPKDRARDRAHPVGSAAASRIIAGMASLGDGALAGDACQDE